MLLRIAAPAALAVTVFVMAACSSDGALLGPNALTTSAVTPPVDPACVTLTSQIDGLRKEGVADKIEKAAAKKYKMTPADLTKADQLTKANAAFQAKCSTVPPKPAAAQASATGTPASGPQVAAAPSTKAGFAATAKAAPAQTAAPASATPKQ